MKREVSRARIVYCVTWQNPSGKFENLLEITTLPNGSWMYTFKKDNQVTKREVYTKNVFLEKDKWEIKTELERLFTQRGYFRVHIPRGPKVGGSTLFDGFIGEPNPTQWEDDEEEEDEDTKETKEHLEDEEEEEW